MEHKPTVSAETPARGAALPGPVLALQLVDRNQLRMSLKPTMNKASFANWIFRAMKEYDFPQPVRVGLRSVAWSVPEVQAWLASRPRGGTFAGRRRTKPAPEVA